MSVSIRICMWGLPRWFSGKESACNAGDTGDAGQPLSQEEPLEKETATHSSILAWKIPCTEESGRQQFMGLQRVETTEVA